MRHLRWQLLIIAIALGVIALLLFTQQQQQTNRTEEKAPVNVPRRGGVYTEALIGSFGRLNPLLDYYNQTDYDIDRLIFSSLVRFNDRGLPVGELAVDWGISQDGKSYSFAIHPQAVWHDGQPVTAEDVVFTVSLLQDPKNPLPVDLKAFWRQIQVVALDEKVVQFRLPEAFAPFLDYLTFGVLPRHLLEGLTMEQIIDAPFNLQPVGSGPFRFESLQVEGERVTAVTLRAFPDYYGQKPYLDQVVFRYYADAAAALFAFRQGQVTGISQLPSDVLSEALKEPELQIYTGRLPRTALVYLNLKDPNLPFFQDASLRKALLMAINRQYLIDHLLGGQAVLAAGPIFVENWAYYGNVPQVTFDRQAALALVRKAGYVIPPEGGNVRFKDGVRFSFELVYPEDEVYAAIARRLQEDWAAIGVEAVLKPVPTEELLKDYLEPRRFQAALVEINLGRLPDPDPYPFWHQSQILNGQNYGGWDDRQVSEYLEQARVLPDLQDRLRRYRNFQVRFANDLPALLLFHPVYSFGVQRGVFGVSLGPVYDPSDRFSTILNWYLNIAPATP